MTPIMEYMRKRKGFFITLEGPDGSGKTTQTKLLVAYLKKKGYTVILTREPGGTKISELIRHILLEPSSKVTPLAELLLYEAGRAEHVNQIILPALKSGSIVVSDRYTDATLAYQGWGRGLDIEDIKCLNNIATGGLMPDLTICLDIGTKTGLARAAKKAIKKGPDRLESESIEFHKRVRKGYIELAEIEPDRIRVVSSANGINEIHKEIVEIVEERLQTGASYER